MKKILSLAVVVTLLSGTAAWATSVHPAMHTINSRPASVHLSATSMHAEFNSGGAIRNDTAQTAHYYQTVDRGAVGSTGNGDLSAPMDVGSCNEYGCD